jgi:hypothetical protein
MGLVILYGTGSTGLMPSPWPAAWLRYPEISEALPMTWLWVGVYRKANTKWSPLLRQCEQRTRGAIRNLGRGVPGTRAALFSGLAHSFALVPPIQIFQRMRPAKTLGPF